MNKGIVRSVTATISVLLVSHGIALPQGNPPALYTCSAEPNAQAGVVGLTLCDAEPTAELTEHAAPNNWQVRDGALVIELDLEGISDVAGLHSADMIYRVGGVDVGDAETAAEALAQIGSRSDTVVNFLRGGRPYRVKLRRH